MKIKVPNFFRYITQLVLLVCFKLRKIYKPSLLSSLKIENIKKKSVYSPIALVIFLLATALVVSSLGTKTTYAVSATKYPVIAGGNWNTDATWTLNADGTANATTKPDATDDVIMNATSGPVTINAASVAKTLNCTGYTNTLTHNAFTLTVSGSITFASTMTYTSLATSTVVMAATGTLTTGTKLMPLVSSTVGIMTLGDNLSFMASQVMKFTLSGTSVDLNGKTVSGNSAINRLLIQSSVVGTPQGITMNGGTFSYADFQDIAFTNGADLDLSAITGLSGDCGGNTLVGGYALTFTSPTTQTFASTTGSWSNVAKWTSRIPLPQDIARFQAMSAAQTITVDMPRLPDTSFSSVTNTPTVLMNVAGLTYAWYGSVNLTGAGTWTNSKATAIISRNDVSITSNGKTFGYGVAVYMPSCTLTLADAFVSGQNLVVGLGTLTTNSNVTFLNYVQSANTVVNMGSGTWTLTGTIWTVSGGTTNSQSSTITLSNTTAAQAFSAGTRTYNNISITPSAFALTFSGAFTFANMTMASAGTKTIKFTKNTTYTMTGANFLSGTAENLVTISSDTAGTAFTLSKSSGKVLSDYLSLQDSAATGGAVWMLTHSTNVSGNTGWIFKTPIYISDTGGDWSSTSAWTGGVVPTSADFVMATATSGNLTIDSAAACSSLDLSSYLGTLTHNAGVTLSIGDASDGSLWFGTGMTYAPLNNETSVITFISTINGNNITWAGKSIGSVSFNGVGGGWAFLNALVITNLTVTSGTLTVGSSAITVSGNWTINGGTFVANTSTLTLNGSGTQSITSGSQSYNNLMIANASATGVIFTDAATISGTFTDTTNSSKLTFNSGSTYTFNTINIAGGTGNPIILQASGAANWIFIPTAVTTVDYVNVSKSTNIGAIFCASNSNDSGGNQGWLFSSGLYCHFTYYVDATGGLDANSGIDTDHPWKTISKVNGKVFNPGDSILFKRGETWREELHASSSGTLGNQIAYGAYGPDYLPLPVINGADIISGSWVADGGNIYHTAVTPQPYIAVFDGAKGALKADIGSLVSDKDWYWAANTLSIYSSSDPAGRVIEAGARGNSIKNAYNAKNYITIDSIHMLYANNYGVSVAGANWIVQNCVIEYIGEGGSGILLMTAGTSATIQTNTIQHASWSGITISIGTTATVQNNIISDIWNGLDYPVSGNGVGVWLLGTGGLASGNKITECYEGIKGNAGNSVINNIVIDSKVNGIKFAGTVGYPTYIIGNTIIHNPDYPSGHGILVTNESIVKNNIIYGTYTGATDNVQLVALASATYTNVDIDYNLYYLAPGSTSNLGQLAGSMYSTLGAWQSALATTSYSGKDVSSLSADPKLIDLATNFHLQSTSPAIDAGLDLNINTDYAGKQRYDMPWVANTGSAGAYTKNYVDIGAYEYVTPPDPTFTSSSHPSHTALYSSKSVSQTLSSGGSATTNYHYLVAQAATPTSAQVSAGVLDTDGIFTAAIPSDGQWYIHTIAVNLDNDSSTGYSSYLVNIGTLPTPTPTSSESATATPGTTPASSLSRRLFPWITGATTSSSASFTTIPTDLTNIEVGQTITFDASSSGSNIVKYEWDFGDGATSNEMKVDHKYETPGRYTVTLTTTDKSGNKSTVSKAIDIRPPAPTISNIKADGTSIVFEGESFPKTTVSLTIHSNPYTGQTVADKDGKFSYTVENGSETLGEGDHTVLASAAIILPDNTQLKSKDSKTYDFKVSVDNGKLKVEMGKTRTWKSISLGLGLLLVIGIGFVLIRMRKRKNK